MPREKIEAALRLLKDALRDVEYIRYQSAPRLDTREKNILSDAIDTVKKAIGQLEGVL